MIVSEPPKNRFEPVSIPQPLLVVIEDVGWWNGHSRPEVNQPFRTSMSRLHCPEDYSAIIQLARHLKTQILAGFVFCEWDRTGILRELPTATWMGSQWPGCMAGHTYQTQVVSIINENPEYLRVAMHGVGHECWIDGVASRSEFHDANNVMRNKDQVINHIRMFAKLLKTSGLETPFPQIFIPPALKHSFGDGDQGFQKILSDFGIRHVLTVFEKAKQFAPPMSPMVTQECGVTLIERGLAPVSWDHVSAEPEFPFNHPVIPLHWANILHPVPEKNAEVIDRWAEFLEDGARRNGYVFLPDVDAALSQIIFYQLTRIQPIQNGAILDISVVKRILSNQTTQGFYVKLPTSTKIREQDIVMEPADHIQEGLVRLIPSQYSEQITLFFE